MSERNTDPIRVAPGSLTIDPLFPAPAAPRPPQPSPEQLAQVEEARQRDEDLQRWHAEQEAAAPGRYSLVDEREVAARQEDWRKKNASSGVGGDIWRGLQIGADKIPRAVREVVRALPAIGPGIVAGVDAIDRWQHGRDSETFFEEKEARLRAGQTPAQQEAGRKQWVEETQNPDGSVSYSMGSAWSDPRSYLGAMVESLPGTVVTMVPAAALARGAYAGAMARGLGERAAAAAAARTATIAGGVGEGLLSGGETSAEVREAIAKMPEDTLRQSEAYRSLLEAGKSPAEARAALADDRAVKGMLIAGVATGLFGGMGDRALAKIVAEGVQGGIGRRTIAGAARGAVAEGVFEELPQSVAEQVAKNYAVQGADPNQRLMEGVPNAAAGGLVVGNLMGAGMGGAGGAARPAPALPAPASAAEAKGQAVATGAVEGPTGPLSAALDYGARQGGAPTTAPAGAPPAGSEVQIRMPRGQSLPGRIEGYSPTGEPMVRAEITDPETGEITTQTLEVPLSQLAPARPIAPPPARPEMGPEIVPEIPGQAPATPPTPITGPLAAAPIPDVAPPAAAATRPVPGTEAPRDVTAEAAEPMGRIPATERSELPARKDTVPLTERPALAGPGQRVIVDDPATVGRFGATLESFSPDGSSALVRGDGGQTLELPLDKIRVTGLSVEQQRARDLAANPPVERETITGTVPTAREVRGKQIVMPDEMHARLFDFGKMRRDSKATLGRGALDLDTDRPMAEQVALAQHFGVSPQRLAQIADDYRYRVERAAKEATTRTPVKMAPVTDKMLSRMKAEDKREAAKAEDANQPEAKAAPAVEAPAAPIGDQDVSTPAPIEAVAAAGETRELRGNPAIDEAAHEAATSPTNDRPEPTQAQKEAGNYKLGHITLAGLDISIENPAGSERKGVDRDGKAWAITMKSHYGYIKGTRGRDKDHIDVFVRPGIENLTDDAMVFVVDQVNGDTGRFDEHKVMIGWDTAGQARAAYLANYAKGWKGLGSITPATLAEFKAWLAEGDTTKLFTGRERNAPAAEADDGITVNAATRTPAAEIQTKGGAWTAVAQRAAPFSSERGYGDTPQAAQADARRRLGASPAPAAPAAADAADGNAAAAVRDAKETAAGRLPIEDDRARERAEKIRRAEAEGLPLVSGGPRTAPTSESAEREIRPIQVKDEVVRRSKAGTFAPIEDEQSMRVLLRRDGGVYTPEGLEVMVWPNKGTVIVRDRDSGQLVTRKQWKDPATPIETLIDEAVRLANLQGEKKAAKPRQSTEERAAELTARLGVNAEPASNRPARDYFGIDHPIAEVGMSINAVHSGGMIASREMLQFFKSEGLATGNAAAWKSGQRLKLTERGEAARAAWKGFRVLPEEQGQLLQDLAAKWSGSTPPPAGNSPEKPDGSAPDVAVATWGNPEPVVLRADKQGLLASQLREIVVRRGKETGVEHLVGVDPDRNVVMVGSGTVSNSGWSTEADAMVLDPANRIVIHHNHPSSRSLSITDVAMLASPGLESVHAHGHDGSSYRARLSGPARAHLSSMEPNRGKMLLRGVVTVLDRALYEHHNPLIRSKEDAETASAGHAHVINTILHQAGIIEYGTAGVSAASTEHLTSTPADLIEREVANAQRTFFAGSDVPAIRRADRSADTLRHPGDVGIALEAPSVGSADAGGARPDGARPADDRGEAAAVAPAALDFSGNKLFTADKVAAARARLRAKMRQVNSGIDPETLIDGMTIAGAYIEAGVRSFSDYARRMVDDLGPNVRPYLLSFWEGTRHYPGLDTSGMTTAAESARLHQEIMNAPATAEATPAEEKADGREDTADAGDRGQLAADEAGPARAPESERNAGDGAAGRGQPDDVGDRRADRRRDEPGRGDGEGASGVPDAGRAEGRDDRAGTRRADGDVPARDDDAGAGSGRGRDRQGYEARVAPPPTDPQPSGGLVAQARPTAYTITDADEIGSGGAKAKFRNNVAAIRLLQKLEEEARPATRDEQSVLAKWVGWGGLRPAFAREDGSVAKGWEKEAAELRELMTPEEYRAAESSTRNAHYTAPEIVKAMWSAVDRLGFKGGQILEPSVGAGNFLGLAPASVRATGRFTGVELDRITGRIAKNLYLDANIQAPMGYQDLSVPDGYFDLAIGNPPFGSERVHDKLNPKIAQFSIHNYFFAKSVDGLRPGGVLAMVITSRFLDGADSRARAYIAQKADLLGAIRLPNDAFLKNAGTSVTTDIVFLQRREEGATPKPTGWIEVDAFTDKEGRNVPLNRYFIDNPDMMLGDFGAYGTMYGPDEPALIAREGDNLPQLVRKAINALPANVMPAPAAPVVGETPKAPMNVRDALEGSMFLDPDGKIWRRDPDSIGEPQASLVDLGDTAAARVAQMIRIRDTFARLRAAQLDPKATDEKIENLRERLNKVYDAHVSKFGPINADANKRLFREDPTWPQISALEDNFDKGVSAAVAKTTGEAPRAPTARKAAIFTKRTQQPYAPPTSAASAKDALAAVLSEYGRVDMRAMEQIYGQPEADIVTELGSLIFKTPAGEYETADGYLSGNVKQKLAEARRAAEQDPSFRANVAALEEVQPADIEAVDIDVKSGSPWVPANHVVDFVNHIIDGTGSKAFYSKMTASWVVTPGRASQSAQTLWATEDASINRVIDAALNHSRITISEKNSDGSTTIDHAATEAANEKVEKVKAEWRRWVWEDDARRDELARLYNDTFNTDVEPQFDGSHLKLPGKVSDDIISFRPHQLNAVWRATQTGTALFDHTVGAGKTFAGIASVMELRRTGRAKKPMVVVPNHLVGQWAADFVKLYPGARVLAPTEKDFDKENRQRLFARILTSDWDAVIVAHSSFKKIGVSAEYEAAYLQHQVAQIMASMQEVRAATGEKSRNVSQLSKQRDALQTRLQKLMEGGGKDVGLVWDDLGIDALMVDEAHEFKNLGFATSMQRVAGLGNPTGSQKASDLAIKIRHLLDTTGGRNLIFLTGTPISNSMAEMFTVQRYLAGRKLEQMGLAHFDAWARVFGEVVTDWELSPTGQYKQNSRFARFTNVPELMQLYRSFADVIVNDDIKAMLAAQGKRFPLPKVKGGKPTNVVVERSPDQAEYIGIGQEGPDGQLTFPGGSLIWRAENLPKKAEKGADNMLKIMSDARKAALDMRLIGQGYGDVANSKVHRAADEMVRIYKQWDKDRGAQLVFIDLSTPQAAKAKEAERIRAIMAKAEQGDEAAQEALDNLTPDELSALDGKFSVYDDLRQKLIDRGIPPAEIAFIHSANTDLQKQELFGKVRSGRVRFLFGSTPKMGAGTNVQNRLVALHHLDAPWRPSDLEQRDGRGIRQGNELYDADPDGFEIEILRYATKNTLDARQWQTIEAKARFIEQLRKGNVKERTVEDIAGEASNAAEMKAAASGNPKILEEMTLRQRLRKLDAAMVEHDRGQHRVKGAIGASMRETNRIEELLPGMEKDAAMATETLAGEFTATIRGAAMEKPSEMGLAIINAAKEMLESGAERSPVGSYGPFKLALQWVHTTSFRLAMAGALTHEISVGDVKEADPTGLSLKITNTARWLVKEPDAMRARLARLRAELPKLQAQIGPFAQAAELAETRDQHAAILAELRPKPKPPAAAQAEGGQKDSIADGEPVATIDGTELGVEFRSAADMPALRRGALAWFNANLRGTTALMADGTEVRFNRRGGGKVTSNSKGDLLLRAVPAIRAIIERGTVVHREPGTRPAVIERIIVAAPVNMDGAVQNLAVSIHRQSDGHWQYDFTMDREGRAGGPGVNTGGLATREGPVPSLEVPSPRRAGDANTTDKDSVSAPGQDLNLMVWGEVPKASGDAEVARVLAVIDRSPLGPMVRRLIAAGRVAIVSQAYEGAAPGVQAFATRDGRISLVAPMLTDANVMPVLLHEAFHAGTRRLIGDAAWSGLTDRLARLHRQFERSPGAARTFYDEAARRVRNAGISGVLTAEEFGAYAIEHYEAAPRALRGWIDDVLGRVKAWALATFGRQLGAVTPAQLRALAVAAIRDQSRATDQIPVKSADQNPIKDSVRDAVADVAASAGAMLDQRSIVERIRGATTDIQPTLLAAVPLNYFSELKRPGMTSVDAYLRTKRDMDTYRANRHETMVTIAEDWRKFAGANRAGAESLSQLMNEATLASYDPALARPDPGNSEQIDIAKRWDALPPAAQKLYRRVRDAFVEQQNELDAVILANIDKAQLVAQRKVDQAYRSNLERVRRDSSLTEAEKRERIERLDAQRENDLLRGQWAHKARMTRLRQRFESNRLPAPYFPLTRFGRYFVTIRNSDGDVVSFSRFEREAERRRWVRENWSQIQKDIAGAVKEEGVIDQAADLGRAMDPRIIGEIDVLLGEAGVDATVMDAIWQRYLQTMPDLSIRKRFIHRKGTSGFQADALKGFASHMFHAAHQMARLKYSGDLTEALNGAADEARKSDDPTRATTLVNELRKRHQWVMNPTGSRAAQAVTSAMFAWYLAATPAAAIVNMTQPVMLGVPIIGARFGGIAKASAAMAKAAKETVNSSGSIQNSTALSSEEQAAVRAFYESGLIERTQSHDLAGIGETGVEYSPLRHKVMSKIGWMFHRAEIWNREVTALTAYRMARENGQTHREAIDTAHDLTWKVNFDYSNSNRARILQGDAMKLVGVFQNFQLNMWYRLFRDMHQSFKGETPQARTEARYQLAGIIGMMGLLGGVTGIAGYNIIMAVAGMFFGDDEDPFEFKHQVERSILNLLGPTLGGIVLKGAPGHLTGIDLTSRIGMPDFFLREPSGNKEGAEWWKQLMFSAAGVVPSTIYNTIRGFHLIAEGKTARGVEAVVPKAVRDVMKAYRYANEGVQSQRGDEIVPVEKISAWDLIAQVSGFTPAHISESFERNSRIRDAQTKVQRERRDLLNQFALASRLGDADTREAVLEKIRRWNTRAYTAGMAITSDTLQQSLATRQRNAARREDGVLIANQTLNRTLRDGLGIRINQ